MNRMSLNLLVLGMVLFCMCGPANAETPTREEMATSPPGFAAELAYLDANKDGKIGPQELAQVPQLRQNK